MSASTVRDLLYHASQLINPQPACTLLDSVAEYFNGLGVHWSTQLIYRSNQHWAEAGAPQLLQTASLHCVYTAQQVFMLYPL